MENASAEIETNAMIIGTNATSLKMNAGPWYSG